MWVHYLVLAVPALMLALRAFAERAGPRAWALGAALLPLSTGVMALLATADRTFVLAAVALNVSVAALLAIALGAVWRGGVDRPKLREPASELGRR